jgi:signal transduction histidine kinase
MTRTANVQRRPRSRSNDAIAQRAVRSELRLLERAFDEQVWIDERAYARARKRARARAYGVLAFGGASRDEHRVALLVAASELFGGVRAELVGEPCRYAALARRALELTGMPAVALARDLMRSTELLNMLPSDAVQAQLATLIAFAPLRSCSLWVLDEFGAALSHGHVGDGGPSRAARELARSILAGERVEAEGPRRLVVGLPVGRSRQPLAALTATARPMTRGAAEAFLREATPMLAAVIERDSLLTANAASERTLVASSERKLTRLGFDLHDGPIQEVAVLADDVRLFRDQLEVVLANAPQRKLVRGRFEDLDAQLVALDSELRRISNEVHTATVLLNRPFGAVVEELVRAFHARTNVRPRLALEGDMSLLSGSQQIALLNVVHEALANIREHSDATRVVVAISVSEQGIEVQISDNGRGFDVEPTLVRAVRKGHLGLVAMHERVRLLGGQCRIESRAGGPTTINVALERWAPLVDGPSAAQKRSPAAR